MYTKTYGRDALRLYRVPAVDGRRRTGRAGPGAGATNAGKRRSRAAGGAIVSSAGVTKPRATTARPLRSPLVQERMKRAHDLVVSAIVVEEEETSAIAKPFYLVQELVPNLRWPDGGVVLYGLSLFLPDLSWQQSGSWICFCRNLACAPHGISQGGTYEVGMTLQDGAEDASGPGSTDGSGSDCGSDYEAGDMDGERVMVEGAGRETDNPLLEEDEDSDVSLGGDTRCASVCSLLSV
ncbi:hypothetical protein I4F81_009828 [Pyropia yezoensis]|uniref:Uncharacterized protein n=1 Tax=Pyropia yezoensis TaxID=2788 RepID=A0ACC3CC10_PYRYE|nr:hypothetical protein I4F81_009828 [Neopyropia yezoensis]